MKNTVIVIYCLCFAAGTLLHAGDIADGGLFPYRASPLWMNVFWTSLVILYPLVIGLFLAGRPRPALLLSLGLVSADFLINAYRVLGTGAQVSYVLVMQGMLFGFVLGSIALAWPRRQGLIL